MLPAIKNCKVLSALLNTFDHVYKKFNYTKLKKKKKLFPVLKEVKNGSRCCLGLLRGMV